MCSEMKFFFAFLPLTLNLNIKFQYIKTCIPSKIPRGGGQGVREGLGIAKIMAPVLVIESNRFLIVPFPK